METCYVCGEAIKQRTENHPRKYVFLPVDLKMRHITSPVYVGNDTFRHKSCEPGGARWMAIQAAKPRRKRSELYPYFFLDKTEKL